MVYGMKCMKHTRVVRTGNWSSKQSPDLSDVLWSFGSEFSMHGAPVQVQADGVRIGRIKIFLFMVYIIYP